VQPKPTMNLLRSLLCILVLLSMQACTVVRIDSQDGTTRITRRFGIVTIEPGTASSLVRVTSLGAHSAFGVLSLGYGHTEAVTVEPGACQIIVWDAGADTLHRLQDLVGADGHVCLVDRSTTHNSKDLP
jgi:hypothetical protein